MKEIIIAWIKRPFSLGKIKVLMFIPFIGAIFFDFSLQTNTKTGITSLSSGVSTSVYLIISIILFFLCLIYIDFRNSNNNRQERSALLESIKDPAVPREIKDILIKQYERLS